MVVPTSASSPSYAPVSRLRKSHRGGFRTSICDLFSNPARRSDCCSIACCGVLQSDKNRYLFNGERPSWVKRVAVNFLLPCIVLAVVVLACALILAAQDGGGENSASNAGWIGLIILLSTIITIGFVFIRGCRIRIQFRRDVMNRIHQERNEDVSFSNVNGDLRSANFPCCGCYQNDVIFTLDDSVDEHDEEAAPQSDFCTHLFQNIASLCCGVCCQCWCQFCGMCAIGQEDREISALVPREKQMIDYITFEPFVEYYPRIVELRQTMTGGFLSHLRAVSKLSRNLLLTVGTVLLLLTALALTRIDKQFEFANLLILVATILQAFVILHFVHWRWHRFDLSFDAVVKLFSSGFVLGISQALVFEWIVSFIFGIVFGILVIFDLVAEMPEYTSSDDVSKWIATWLHGHIWLFVIAVFFHAYVAAALIEELCKYFAFWMVEHPDFLEKEDWNAIVHDGESTNESVSKANGTKSDNNHVSIVAEHAKQRTLKSNGSAITTAMVTAALGFACCENLLYVFKGTPDGASIGLEAQTLLLRSLFPIHPLAAAIQSIGVCRRDLERDSSFGIGRIILPAVLLHGTYDFVIMLMAVIVGWHHIDDPPPAEGEEVQLSPADKRLVCGALALGFIMVLGGAAYYVEGSRSQKKRLDELECVRTNNRNEGVDVTTIM